MPIASVSAAAKTSHRPVKSSYAGKVLDAGWDAGMGAHKPGTTNARMGLFSDVRINPSFTTTASARLSGKSITITLSSSGGRPNQAADVERKIAVRSPMGLRIGSTYKVDVRDTEGHVLKTKSGVRTMLAM